jgi:hypothetical protein
MSRNPDIDIDFKDRLEPISIINHVPAITVKGASHPSGIYLQNIPAHPFTGLAAMDTEKADDLGYMKVDFLTNKIYEKLEGKDHLKDILSREIPWDFFEDEHIVQKLAHIRDHFRIVKLIQPKSIDDLAVILALVRPAKKHLIGAPRSLIDAEIWTKVEEGYAFKRSHAVAYAVSIIVQLQLLIEQISYDMESSNDMAFNNL